MGAVIVRNPQPRPFPDMRNGPPNRKIFRWSNHSSNRRKASFYALFPGIVTLILSLTAFPLCAQSPLGILTSNAKAAPAQQTTTPTPVATPTPVQAIPLPEIANQAERLDRVLRDISNTLLPVQDGGVMSPEETLHAEQVSQRVRQAEDLLANVPTMMQLQDEERYWRAQAEQYSVQRKLLTERAAGIEKQMRVLDVEQERWKATAEQVRVTPGLIELAERIDQELDAIQRLRTQAQEQLNVILILQNHISEQAQDVSAVLLEVTEANQRLRGRLLERDSYPLWETRELRAFDQSTSTAIQLSARGITGVQGYLRVKKGLLAGIAAVYVFAMLAAFRLRRYVTDEKNLNVSEDASRVFARPYCVALLITLLTTIGMTTSAPTSVSFVVFGLIYLVPVLRLTPGLIKPGLRNLLYVLCAFYVIEWMHVIVEFEAAFKRELFAITIFLALLIMSWLARSSRLRMQLPLGRHDRLLVVSIRIGLLLLAASLCTNILGYVSLSQVLGVGALFSGFIAVLLYTLVRVLDLGLAIALGGRWFQSRPEARSDVVQRWGRRILIGGAFLLWLDKSLYLFAVRDSVMEVVKEALEYPLGFGKAHVTLGGTLSLFFFLLVGYAIANIARFVLEAFLLPRLSLRGGMSYAISRVTYYVVMVGIFFAALSDAGVELNKFTVITGAVGLGVGFGLQNIVNNFASGLIILFERPFRIGDTVEVGGVMGTVKRIGARSSTVLTFQYAEVILPNSNLLSDQVTNWTLTSARRRVEVPVGVAYGTNPESALKLLIEVAEANTRILKEPRPEAFFLGFGDSALNLELRFWAAQSIWFELKSEVGLAVFRALRQAGIEIPFPQRDLHVHGISGPVQVESPGKDEIDELSAGELLRKVSGRR